MMSEIRCFGAGMECQCAKQWTDAGSRAEPQKSTWKSGPEQDGECDDVTGLGASFPGGRVLGVCASARVCMCVAMRWDGLGGAGNKYGECGENIGVGPMGQRSRLQLCTFRLVTQHLRASLFFSC